MDLIFFSSESWKSILFQKKAPFACKLDAGALFKEKAPLFFEKMQFCEKSKKGA